MSFFSNPLKVISNVVSGASSLFGGSSGLLSGGLDLLGGFLTNNANASQARAQMAFQADQSGTAYQRAVADLKAAGLNPMLAYGNGGASSGSGAMATMQNPASSAVNSANATKQVAAAVENLAAQTATQKSQTALNLQNAIKAQADTRLSNATALKVAEDARSSRAKASQDEVIKSIYDIFNPTVQRFSNSAKSTLKNPPITIRPWPKN